MPTRTIPASTRRAMSKLRHSAWLPLRSATAKTLSSISLILLFFDNQFEYSLSFRLIGHTV